MKLTFIAPETTRVEVRLYRPGKRCVKKTLIFGKGVPVTLPNLRPGLAVIAKQLAKAVEGEKPRRAK